MKQRHDYKTAILKFLAKSAQPVDVENIRVACKIGNWETAVRHCLELYYEARIRGIKSSKSWIFWAVSPKQHKHPIIDGRFRPENHPTSNGGISSQ